MTMDLLTLETTAASKRSDRMAEVEIARVARSLRPRERRAAGAVPFPLLGPLKLAARWALTFAPRTPEVCC